MTGVIFTSLFCVPGSGVYLGVLLDATLTLLGL